MTTETETKVAQSSSSQSFSHTVFQVHLCVFMYSCAVGLAVPVIPFITESLGADSITFGYLQTIFSLFQLIGSPLMGYIGDKYGSKKAIMISYAACSVNYFILGSAHNIPLLYLSRCPSLFQHGFLASSAYISEITPEQHRSHHLGRVAFFFGLGFIIGPSLGGIIAEYSSYSTVAYIGSAVAFISMVVVYIFMADHRTKQSTQQLQHPAHKHSMLSAKKISKAFQLFKRQHVLPLLILRILVSLPSAIFDSMFPIIAKSDFGLDAKANGFVLSYVGLLMAIVQGLLVGFVSKHLSDNQIVFFATALKMITYFLLSGVNTMPFLMALIAPLIVSGALLNTVINSALTKAVGGNETGKILGIAMSISSATRVVSPAMGGYLYHDFGGYTNLMLLNGGMMTVASLWAGYVSRLRLNTKGPTEKNK